MLIKKFPVPCRVDYVPSPYEPDEDGVQDVGYYNGKLSDGRAYRLECWRMDDMLMLTVMFSDRCLEGYRREDMRFCWSWKISYVLQVPTVSCRLHARRMTADRLYGPLILCWPNKKGTYAEIVPSLNR